MADDPADEEVPALPPGAHDPRPRTRGEPGPAAACGVAVAGWLPIWLLVRFALRSIERSAPGVGRSVGFIAVMAFFGMLLATCGTFAALRLIDDDRASATVAWLAFFNLFFAVVVAVYGRIPAVAVFVAVGPPAIAYLISGDQSGREGNWVPESDESPVAPWPWQRRRT